MLKGVQVLEQFQKQKNNNKKNKEIVVAYEMCLKKMFNNQYRLRST